MLLLQVLGIILHIVFAVLLIDLFYADKRIEYLHWRKDNLKNKMEGSNEEWATKALFWHENRNSEYLILLLFVIPLINIGFYIYMLWILSNSYYDNLNDYENKLDRILIDGTSIHSYLNKCLE